jgi:hypothetical protein
VTAVDVIDCIESTPEDVEAQSVFVFLVNVSGKSRITLMFLAVFV